MKNPLKAVLLCFLLLSLSAPAVLACDADNAFDYYRNDLGAADPNDFALMLRGARQGSACAQTATTKLTNKVTAMTTAGAWTQTWSGGALSIALATGLELGAQNLLTSTLDLALRDAANAYQLTLQSTCGINQPNWANGNTCLEDYALGTAAHGWRAAYYRHTGRYWTAARADTMTTMSSTLAASTSCIRKYASGNTMPVCDGTLADLTAGTGYLYSINKRGQSPSYGIGQMVHVSAGMVGLEVGQTGPSASEFGSEQKTIAQHLFREGVDKAVVDPYNANRATWHPSSCVRYNDTNNNLVGPWPCWDDENDQAYNPSLIGDTPYRPDMFPVRDFYTKYSLPTWSGGTWNFDDDSTGDDDAKFNDLFYASDPHAFWGPARREMYWTMGIEWLNAAKRPALQGRAYYRGGFKRGSYFVNNVGTGSPMVTSLSRQPGVASAENLTIRDLDTTDGLLHGDTVVISNYDNRYWTAANGGGSTLTSSSTTTNTYTRFTIEKICGTSGCQSTVIAHGDTFALRAPNGTHYVTAPIGGTVSATATSAGANEQFLFQRTTLD